MNLELGSDTLRTSRLFRSTLRAVAAMSLGFALSSCALTETRPTQEMSDTIAALRAAKEVQADIMAPEIFREARESFFKGKREYRLKNFVLAKQLIDRARTLAERAEFEALKSGATRTSAPPDPLAESAEAPPLPPSSDDEYQKKPGVYFESAQENREKLENPSLPPAPNPGMGIQQTEEIPGSSSPPKPLIPIPVPNSSGTTPMQ